MSGTKTGQRYRLLADLMMIDMSGPHILAVDESRAPRSALVTSNVYSQLSGLEDVFFSDFMDVLPLALLLALALSAFHRQMDSFRYKSRQALNSLKTEEQTLESLLRAE